MAKRQPQQPERSSTTPKDPLVASTCNLLKDLVNEHYKAEISSLHGAARKAVTELRDAVNAGLDGARASCVPYGIDVTTLEEKQALIDANLADLKKMADEEEDTIQFLRDQRRQLQALADTRKKRPRRSSDRGDLRSA